MSNITPSWVLESRLSNDKQLLEGYVWKQTLKCVEEARLIIEIGVELTLLFSSQN